MFEQCTRLILVSPILDIFIALLLSFILNYLISKSLMQMARELSDPDLNLHLLNHHGIYTVEEINEL